MTRRLVVVVAIVALVLSACGGGGSGGNGDASSGAGDQGQATGSGVGGSEDHDAHGAHGDGAVADCTPKGTSMAITASGTAFSTDCLAAPARQAVTLTFDNKDSIAHNVAVLESHTATDVLFRGDIVKGPQTVQYAVPALDPGTYVFHCEVHPDKMLGTFVVK